MRRHDGGVASSLQQPEQRIAKRCRGLGRSMQQELKAEITRVHQSNFGVHGVRKVWRQLKREAISVGRDRVTRLMRDLQLVGVTRGATKRTTVPAQVEQRPVDLVQRRFTAPAPNRLWVADLTYVATWNGFCYVAFVLDAFSHRIVGWPVAASLHAELAVDALGMAIWSRRGAPLDGLIHHSDRGVQFLAIRYTERLADAGAVASVGSKGDSYDNAMPESLNGLFKTEVIRRGGPWRTVEDVELATLAWVDWYNHRRLHSACGDIPPTEFETRYYQQHEAVGAA
jgi:putative transposase